MKLGVIGSGTIVQEFLPHLRTLPEVQITALLSTPRSLEKAKALGVPCTTDRFEEFLSAGLDAAYIAVPNHLHFQYIKQVLEAGLHVIAEKPITSNDREALALQALAQEKGLLLFEAITTLYLGNYQKIREWLPRIGTVKLVQSQFCQYSRRYDRFMAGEVLPVFDPAKSGGALMDLGLYNLHFIMGLFGPPLAARYRPNLEKGIDTSGVLTLEYPGFQALAVCAKDCAGSVGGIIQGTKGCIRSSMSPNLVGEVVLELNDGTREAFDDGQAAARCLPEFRAFARAIEANDAAFCQTMLEKSIAVSQVETAARLAAGIRFAADEE